MVVHNPVRPSMVVVVGRRSAGYRSIHHAVAARPTPSLCRGATGLGTSRPAGWPCYFCRAGRDMDVCLAVLSCSSPARWRSVCGCIPSGTTLRWWVLAWAVIYVCR